MKGERASDKKTSCVLYCAMYTIRNSHILPRIKTLNTTTSGLFYVITDGKQKCGWGVKEGTNLLLKLMGHQKEKHILPGNSSNRN